MQPLPRSLGANRSPNFSPRHARTCAAVRPCRRRSGVRRPGAFAVQVIRHAPTTDVSCTGMSPLQAPLPATRALDARFKERYETMRSIQLCTIRRNICAARTRIGHRALRERRPPPRGTRGTVTAVACPHLSSFISLNGGRERRAGTRAVLRLSRPPLREMNRYRPDRWVTGHGSTENTPGAEAAQGHDGG